MFFSFGPDFIVYLVEGSPEDSYCVYIAISSNIEYDPQTFDKAMKSQDSTFWKEAIQDEMDSILGNNTWVPVDLPSGSKPISLKQD